MAETVERAEGASQLREELSVAKPSVGPARNPPAPSDSKTSQLQGNAEEAGADRPSQLPLPLYENPDPGPDPRASKDEKPRRSRGKKGFVPVTRDPDVARSYSDNAALDYAMARGLAHALTSLPPEEMALLKAKVARSPRKGEKGDRDPA